MKILYKINQLLLKTKRPLSLMEQQDVLHQLNKKKKQSLIERSYLQYLCQSHVYTLNRIELLFFLFYPIAILIPLILWLLDIPKKINSTNTKDKEIISILPSDDILPAKFDRDKVLLCPTDMSLRSKFVFSDLIYSYKILFSKFYKPYFFIKNILVIYRYSGVSKTNFKTVLVSNEYSFTSSVLTDYLRIHGKVVINCMHGEKVFDILDAFCTYDKFIVWDDYYVNLLQKICISAQWEVDYCDALQVFLEGDEGRKNKIIYFLQGHESHSDLIRIKETLQKIQLDFSGSRILVKQHPRHRTLNLNKFFSEYEITEEVFESLLADSLLIASNFSTVLFQAYVSREKSKLQKPLIAVNDVMPLPPFYIMREKADILFSQVVE